MHRARFILISFLLLGSSCARATEDLAITNFIRPIVRKFVDRDDAYEWTEAGNGGYILKFSQDMDGDGIPEEFLTSSLVADRSGSIWVVYKINQEGKWSQFAESIRLPIGGFVANLNFPGLTFIDAVNYEERRGKSESEWETPLVHISFSFPSISVKREEISDARATTLSNELISSAVKTEGMLLSDYLEGKRNWESVDQWHVTMSDEKLWRESDWERAKANTSFTAQAALEALEKLRPEGERTSPEKRDARTRASAPEAGSNDNGAASSGRGWAIPVSVIAAAIAGLAALLLRKRKAA